MVIRGLVVIVVFLPMILMGCAPEPPQHELVRCEGDVVLLPRSMVEDGNVHFYTFMYDGRRVNFLVRTDGKGVLHAHLDACHSCYKYKRGFVVEESELVCIACRLSYRIEDEVWDYIGACAPISIHSSLEGDKLAIQRNLLERAARYF